MASVLKRGNSWQVKVRIAGQTRTGSFRRKTDAKAWASEVEDKLRKNRNVPTVEELRRTVGEAIGFYLEHVLPNKSRNRSAGDRTCHLKWWGERLGDVPFVKLKPAEIKVELDKLAKIRKPQTVTHYRASLSNLYTELIRTYDWAEQNPVKRVERPQFDNRRIRFLTDDECKGLLKACKASTSESLLTVVVVALSTGMRQGEILGLRWPDIDLKGERITLRNTKNGETRIVPLKGEALELLRARSKVRQIDSDSVFTGQSGDSRQMRRSFQKTVKQAELKDFRFHDLRHTAAAYLAMNGATLGELAEVLGHKTLAMVKRYSHFTEQHTAALVEKMNEKMFGD